MALRFLLLFRLVISILISRLTFLYRFFFVFEVVAFPADFLVLSGASQSRRRETISLNPFFRYDKK